MELNYREEDLVELIRSNTQLNNITILTDGRVVIMQDNLTNHSDVILLEQADSELSKEQYIRAKQISTYKNKEREDNIYFNKEAYNYLVEYTKDKLYISPDDVERIYLLSCELEKMQDRIKHITYTNKDLKLVSASEDFVDELIDPYYDLIRKALKASDN